jgi:hypothetical protein
MPDQDLAQEIERQKRILADLRRMEATVKRLDMSKRLLEGDLSTLSVAIMDRKGKCQVTFYSPFVTEQVLKVAIDVMTKYMKTLKTTRDAEQTNNAK